MGRVNKCHGCTGRFERSGFVECPDCGETFHEKCLAYHEKYDCREGAEDPAVGAVEF
jgi:predicted RNA-binding Zn-ribbon protein involved in translation (DUF1610 family)